MLQRASDALCVPGRSRLGGLDHLHSIDLRKLLDIWGAPRKPRL